MIHSSIVKSTVRERIKSKLMTGETEPELAILQADRVLIYDVVPFA